MKENTISILIVDDEPEARDLLTILLDRIEGVQVIGGAENVDHALLQVVKKNPDLILLDIQMPEKTGFELVSQLRELELDTGYIFVTAYNEYAIRAVREAAFDYLLKPVDPQELEQAINRFRKQKEHKIISQRIDELLSGLDDGRRLKFNTRSGFIVIDPGDIICCTADGNYTEIVLVKARREIISSNLGNLEKEVASDDFFRISRSALINIKYLTHVDNKSGLCRLQGESVIEVKVARSRLKRLEALL